MKFEGLGQWQAEALKNSGGRGRELLFLFEQPEGENDIIFDLHIHDTNSDGVRGARKVLTEAQENGVEIVSITNHDNDKSTQNIHRGRVDFARYGGRYINGIEITCRLNGYPVECLVYGHNHLRSEELSESYKFPFINRNFKLKRIMNLIQSRVSIANKLQITPKFLSLNDFISVEQKGLNGEIKYVPLSKLGLDANTHIGISQRKLNEYVEVDGEKCKVNLDYFNAKLFKYIIQSENGRKYLAKKGIEVSEYDSKTVDIESLEIPPLLKQSFAKFNRTIIQNAESELYVDDSEWWPSFEQVAEFAKATGGVAILAHPFGYGGVKVEAKELMDMAIEAGADGIECLHGYNTAEQVEFIYQYCKKRGKFITAGSDTHDFYSYQGNKTQIGIAPGIGEAYDEKNNPIHEMPIGTYNLHYIGSGLFRKDLKKKYEENGMGM